MDAPVGPSSRSDNDEDEENEDTSLVINAPKDRIGTLVDELVYG